MKTNKKYTAVPFRGEPDAGGWAEPDLHRLETTFAMNPGRGGGGSNFVGRRFWVFSIVESTTFKMRKL